MQTDQSLEIVYTVKSLDQLQLGWATKEAEQELNRQRARKKSQKSKISHYDILKTQRLLKQSQVEEELQSFMFSVAKDKVERTSNLLSCSKHMDLSCVLVPVP